LSRRDDVADATASRTRGSHHPGVDPLDVGPVLPVADVSDAL